MNNKIQINTNNKWIKPWNIEKFDDLTNHDERFFSILMKGFLMWLNNNIVMYNKPIRHFILNTGSAYLYVENNGYEFSWNETSGEDMMYMEMPRCIVTTQNITIPFEELTAPYSNGIYERMNFKTNSIECFNATIRRIPIEWVISLKYVLSNFNESIILIQEIIDKLTFQQYFNITYLGQIIQCSFEVPSDFNIELNKIDMATPDVDQKSVEISLKICTNYPVIDDKTEISTSITIDSPSNVCTIDGENITRNV